MADRPRITINIVLEPDGNMGISSNVRDKIIMLGILELAKQTIGREPEQKEENKILVPTPIIPFPGGKRS
jgi:hypothetical protein